MHGFSPGEVSMERTHCGLYQAAATDDCKDIVTSGKLLKLIRVFHGVSQSTLAGRTGYHPRNPTNLKATGQNPGHESFGPCARHWQLSAGFLRSPQSRIQKTGRKEGRGAPAGRREAFLLLHSIRAGMASLPGAPPGFIPIIYGLRRSQTHSTFCSFREPSGTLSKKGS